MLAAVTAVLEVDSPTEKAKRLRLDVLESARRRMREAGYFGCSLRDVAADTGTSATSVVRLLGSKYDLLKAVVDESYATAYAWLEAIDDRRQDPAKRLVRGVVEVLDRAAEDPATGDFLIANSGNTDFLLGSRQPERAVAAGSTAESEFFDWFEATCAECVGAGYAPGITPLALTEAVVGIMERFLLSSYLYGRTKGVRYPYKVSSQALKQILQLVLDPAPPACPDGSVHSAKALESPSRASVWSEGSKERLIASAWIAFAKHGFGSATTRAVASGARTSETELFRQFPGGKFELLQAIYDKSYAVVLDDLRRLTSDDPRCVLLDGVRLIWSLYETQPTLVKFIVFNSGNADSLLLMPRDDAEAAQATALTSGTDAYFAWFSERGSKIVPPRARRRFGHAVGQAALGIQERLLLSWYRDEHVLRRAPRVSAEDAIVPLRRLVYGASSIS
jgi:AcrR family transcriptional regulator